MKSVRSRAPLRLGLAGGGSDVAPYCDLYGGCVLNATIDRYAYAMISPSSNNSLELVAADQKVNETHHLDEIERSQSRLQLHMAVYKYIVHNYNNDLNLSLRLTTFCDAPPGSGLGSSSTLVVAMIRAFVEFLSLPIDDYTIGLIAYRIERVDCNLHGGKQDQFSSTFGGFNFMEFYDSDRIIINPLRIKGRILCELEASLLLCYSGVSRESAHIIEDQRRSVSSNDSFALDAMHGIKNEAIRMKEALLRGDFHGFVDSMRDGWENKKRSSPLVSNSHLENIYNEAILSGALAGKVSGAGGGGYMCFYVRPEKRVDVIKSLESLGLVTTNCHFTKQGAQSWRVP